MIAYDLSYHSSIESFKYYYLQLLGYMDLDTREWFDGVLTAAAREGKNF